MTQDQNEDELETLENDNGLRSLSNRQKQQIASKTMIQDYLILEEARKTIEQWDKHDKFRET